MGKHSISKVQQLVSLIPTCLQFQDCLSGDVYLIFLALCLATIVCIQCNDGFLIIYFLFWCNVTKFDHLIFLNLIVSVILLYLLPIVLLYTCMFLLHTMEMPHSYFTMI